MAGLVSDEVAEDYKSSLEDLTTNDRFQISNLTVIAKENTEHAMAISRVLEKHIRSTGPLQKLPALYVVDSIVKNIGTPYTLFLGRNMYQTFMDAYTLSDAQTRRKLDEMLKTWKEPVPGSLDTRPVFPPEITRNIENALIKARTAFLTNQQTHSRSQLRHFPWASERHSHALQCSYPAGQEISPTHSRHADLGSLLDTTPGHRSDADLAAINRELEGLIASARDDFSKQPHDPMAQQRLRSLLDLQNILQHQQLSLEQRKAIRDQLSALAIPRQAPQTFAPPPPAPVPSAPAPVSTPPAQTTSQPLQQLLNPATLAELIKKTSVNQQPTPPPQIPAALPSMPQVHPNVAPSVENPLIAALRARGLLPSASAPPMMAPSNNTPPTAGALPFFIPGQLQSTPVPMPQAPAMNGSSSSVPMNTASMKIPRLHLVVSLYDAKSNRCGTCGRRFLATEEGREKKARHLDWHFKTNQRMTEAAKRAQTRSWYVDERDWIKSREADDEQDATGAEATAEGAAGADGIATQQGPPKQWIRAPNDATLRNTPCPICQEKFEPTWSEEEQDWIWQDAVRVGPRIYHASCYNEVTKDGPARNPEPQARTSTPDSVLGKRKAEGVDSPGQKVRIKTEI
ncbi:hypothetical protein N7470_000670 [Penicillium chermesinum]|nr:hypothetical protein N7470_000670 [Penicillium chermesinum]